MTGARTPEWRNRAKLLFPSPDLDDLYHFSPLHATILSLDFHLELEKALRVIGGNINIVDSNGRTPLSWAAQRGDSETTQQLLSLGADCNQADKGGYTPLHYAVQSSTDCVKLLLGAGAVVHAKINPSHAGLLTIASAANPSDNGALATAKALIEAGGDRGECDAHGCFPLILAIWLRKVKLSRYLLDLRADLTRYDCFGENELSMAVKVNLHPLTKLLLDRRQDHTVVMVNGNTLMHDAAKAADTETLRLLKSGNMQRRNIHIRNKDGYTPMQVGLRREANLEWKEALTSFLRSIDQDSPDRIYPVVLRTYDNDPEIGSGLGETDSGCGSEGEYWDAIES